MGQENTNPINEISSLLTGQPLEETPKAAPVEREETTDIVEDESQSDTSDVELEDGIENGPDEAPAETQEGDETNPEAVPEEGDVDTLNDFASELEMKVEDLYELNIKMPNGDPITLGGLKDFYEVNQDITEARAELDQQRQVMQEEMETIQAQPGLSNEIMQARAQVLSIEDQYNKIDWNSLRQQNPGQYAAAQQDFHTQYDIAVDNQGRAEHAINEHLETAKLIQQQKLMQAVPELKDAEYRAQVSNRVITLAERYGFTPADVGNIEDHRLMRLLIDASNKDSAAISAKEKIVKNVPVTGKSSPAKAIPISTRKATLKALTEKARKSNDNRDKTNAITELLK